MEIIFCRGLLALVITLASVWFVVGFFRFYFNMFKYGFGTTEFEVRTGPSEGIPGLVIPFIGLTLFIGWLTTFIW